MGFVLCALAALVLPGCGGKGMVSASATESALNAVLDRHDAAVNGTLPPLSDFEKATALRSSALLRKAWNVALERDAAAPVQFQSAVTPSHGDTYAPLIVSQCGGRLVGCTNTVAVPGPFPPGN